MFQSIVENKIQMPSTPGSSAGETASIGLVKSVARIQTMIEREGATLAEAYAHFEEAVYPQITKHGSGVPQMIKNQIAGVLLDRLALEKPRDFESSHLPSVTRITELMIELDVLKTSIWATLVIELVQHIYRQKTVPDAYDSIKDYETAMALRDALLHDLLGAWRLFCAQRVSPDADSPVKPLEASERKTKPSPPGAKSQQPSALQIAFGAMFPQYSIPSLMRPTFAAFATYKLLTDPFNRSRSTDGEAVPFLQMMKDLIFQTRPPHRKEFEPIFHVFPDLPRFVWPRKQADDGSSPALNSDTVFAEKSDPKRVTLHRQLGDAINRRNLNLVKKAWLEFWGEAASPDAARITELAKYPDMFDYFILAYTMLRRPQQAIEVWNNMERIGIQATIKTWNSMLQGCAKANNAHGIKTVWNKLLASGVKLDVAIWTARIHGLFNCGEADAGIRALDEMAKVWAARGNPQYAAIAVQPTVEPVNAALAGLLRLNRSSDATKVLAWASKQGINPDIYTFNTLLRPLVRRGDMKGIDEIFAVMQSIDIRPDNATFTVLLEGTLNHIGDLSPAQQVSVVERILDAIKASGVDINMQTYAKILHLLLREGDRAEEPVKAVLAHIWRRGLELTSHIYTMLAEHYFSRDPPDTAAVTALIENRRLHENKGIDRVFWERMIEGYCQAGETARALEIFDRVFGPGTMITFGTLYELLRPLVAAGDAEAALRVVEAARKIGKADDAGEVGEGKRYWKHRFWHLAYEHGLMGEQLAERFRDANF
jgi:pentatricopeptide repeat protein